MPIPLRRSARDAKAPHRSVLALAWACIGLATIASRACAADSDPLALARADRALVQAIRAHAHPLTGDTGDYDALLTRVAGVRFVLLGEDTHGTEETYAERARITRRLIEDLGFDGVVIESDFTAVERANRYVLQSGEDREATAALGDHRRFPRWMWVNRPIARLLDDLRQHNARGLGRAEVFGMDLHGLDEAAKSLRNSIALLAPELQAPLDNALACLAAFEFQADRYRDALSSGKAQSCASDTTRAAVLLDQWARDAATSLNPSQRFSLAGNLSLLIDSEAYSRLQVSSQLEAWNLRDLHLADAVDVAANEIESRSGRPARLVIWAHNTHIADARATDRGQRSGYMSLGQALRERHPGETYLVGVTTRLGTVRAAPQWGESERVYELRRPAWESVQALFGRTKIRNFMLFFDEWHASLQALDANLPLRAIGVVYWPHRERSEHYFRGELRQMFDAVIHLDRTRTLQ